MVKDQVEDGSLGWIPWKARTSDAVELQFLENRRPRNDKQLLHSILRSEEGLLDESAEAQIPKHEPVELVLTRFQTLLTNCLALLEVAHLLVLKRFAHKFLEVATAVPRDPGLRAPSLQEILDADRTIWLTIADIVRDNRWSYNDTLNEVAFCRQDIHSALQPRLVSNVPVNHRKRSAPEVPPPPPPHPEPRPKKTPPKKEGKKKLKMIWQDSWCKKTAAGVGICVRWRMTYCKSGDSCVFAHCCPIPGRDKKPCEGKRKVHQHTLTL